jgi:UDP-N-acetylmuramoylalanine--D-glutamate ligase
MNWSAEKVVIIGAARQGIALARYLIEHGALVVITDIRPLDELSIARESLDRFASSGKLTWVCGGHPISVLEGATLVCPSGGVPLTLPLIMEARKRGIPLSNDSQIFLEAAPCKVVGITGSAGKTTTTTLVGRMAYEATDRSAGSAYRQTWVGGNIGSPLISHLDQMTADDLVIMELSSFQLEIMTSSPDIAAVLNISPNHLDRHLTMDAYTAAKSNIIIKQNPSDSSVLGRDDPGAWSLVDLVPGILYSFGFSDLPDGHSGTYLHQRVIYLRVQDASAGKMIESPVMTKDVISLRGEHNLLNVMAACTIAAAAGLSIDVMKAGTEGFMGVPHRLEFVRRWGGADWYNDSIATAPERAIAAIKSFHEPLVLLAGGRDKDLPWDDFADLVRRRVRHLIVFGEAAEIILKALGPISDVGLSVSRSKDLHQAVAQASKIVRPGDVVLLSPGGTSFDEFTDFEERGECFARWVRELQ